MLGMCIAHPEIPRLPVLPQVSKMKPSVFYRVHLHVQGGLACVLHAPRAWCSCAGRWAARETVPCRAMHGLRALPRQLRCGSGLKAARVASCEDLMASP